MHDGGPRDRVHMRAHGRARAARGRRRGGGHARAIARDGTVPRYRTTVSDAQDQWITSDPRAGK